MVAALRRMGFAKVFDTNFTADLTIIEEGHELLSRLKAALVDKNPTADLPMFTSCSPGWINYMEHFYPQLIANISTCKSPQQMFGALAKTYYADLAGLDPQDVFVASIMPCTAKKSEAARPEMNASGHRDVDVVLTTRELGRLIRSSGLRFGDLPDEDFDPPMGESTGAGTIFGTTGGVMEAALRTVYAVVVGRPLPSLDLVAVRGLAGIKQASLDVGELGEVRVAVAHGLANARTLLGLIESGAVDLHFVEVMACPGGCIGGGGQPLPVSDARRQARAAALYRDDSSVRAHRQSHENAAVQNLYERFLGAPLGERSHHLLHTHYTPRRTRLRQGGTP
jgi:iron-only hydrogenase group A